MGWAVWAGWRDGEGLVLFFFIFFTTFTQKSFQVFLKTFKPHNQTKSHAFNMMHNHLGIF
jgi:hypothetical protein